MSIATSLAALAQAKTDIASAITAQGGTVGEGDGLADFAADIATIPTGYKVETQVHELTSDAAFIDYTPVDITDIAGAILIYMPLSNYGDSHSGMAVNARVGDSQWGAYRGSTSATYYGVNYGAVVYPTSLSSVIRFDRPTNTPTPLEASPYKAGSYFSIVWGT